MYLLEIHRVPFIPQKSLAMATNKAAGQKGDKTTYCSWAYMHNVSVERHMIS